MSEHTPTPWKKQLNMIFGGNANLVIATTHVPAIYGNGNKESNAEFIVRACNNHNDLITLLEDFADVVEAFQVHGDVDLSSWVAKAREQVEKAKL